MSSEIESALAKVWGKKKGDASQTQQLLGTAFFISPTLLITCKHVVEALASNQHLYVKFIGEHAPQLVHYQCHPDFDLALLELQSNSHSGVVISLATQERSTIPEKGMISTAYGFREDTHACNNNKGEIGVYSEKYEKLTFYPKVPFGFSGGPLLDEANHCIGVTIAKSSEAECSYAEPIYSIHDWLQELDIDIKKPVLTPWQNRYLNDLITSMELLKTDSILQSAGIEYDGRSVDTRSVKLSDVYSTLCVDRYSKQKINSDDHLPINAIQIVAQDKNIVLRGDPGCGKTTFTRYWAMRLARELCDQRETSINGGKIPEVLRYSFPIHLELDYLYKNIPPEIISNGRISIRDISEAINKALQDNYPDFTNIGGVKNYAKDGNKVIWFFDGLDEIHIDDSLRRKFLEGFNNWVERLDRNHYVCLTSRPYAYSDVNLMNRFQTANFVDLTEGHCIDFINKFFKVLKAVNPKESKYSANELISLLRSPDRRHLLTLCLNPMLASLACVVYFKGGKEALPKDRAGLYEKCIENILNRWEDKHYNSDYTIATIRKDDAITNTIPREKLLLSLQRLAFYAHLDLSEVGSERRQSSDISDQLLEHYFLPYLTVDAEVSERDIKKYLYQHTGVLIDRDGGRYAFMHRTFREFLASKFIIKNDQLSVFNNFLSSFESDAHWWKEVISLLVLQYDKKKCSEIATKILLQCLPVASNEVKLIGSFVSVDTILVVASIECEREKPVVLSINRTSLRNRIINWLLEIIGEDTTKISGCVEAGDYLNILGDPRPGVGTIFIGKENKVELPDISWAEIPSSDCPIEIEGFAETFPIEYQLQMSVYPVTRKQFQAFLDHPNGYHIDKWWSGVTGNDRLYQDFGRQHKDNYPRSCLSWYEASAFCKWLTSELDKIEKLPIKNGIIRLPYEWEWQHAATSCDPLRKTPWAMGTSEIHPTIANVDRAIGDVVSVGIYARNKSDQGVYDLIGNTCEWCANDYKTLDKSVGHRMSIKGGDYLNDKVMASVNYRGGDGPAAKDNFYSIRLVCVPRQEK